MYLAMPEVTYLGYICGSGSFSSVVVVVKCAESTGGTNALASVLYEPLALPLERSPGEDVASEWLVCLSLRPIAVWVYPSSSYVVFRPIFRPCA